MNKIKAIFSKIKDIKHLHIYIAVLIGVILCVIYFGSIKTSKKNNKTEISTTEYTSAVEYVDYLENKLCNVLSKISGVGSANVAITLDGGFAYDYATNSETKTTSSSGTETSVTTSTVILVSNEPVVEKEIYPSIKGVVVVAKGAENVNVKLNILSAIETVLQVNRNNITILS